jgi:hypothetical protein
MEVLIRRRGIKPTGATVLDGEPARKEPSKLSEGANSPGKLGEREYGVGELARQLVEPRNNDFGNLVAPTLRDRTENDLSRNGTRIQGVLWRGSSLLETWQGRGGE